MVVIAVTGHRILMDLDKILSGINEALTYIGKRFPGEPVAVLSALAEGADRIVVQQVLQRKDSKLIAVLPLNKSDYLQDLRTSESKREFDDLLDRASEVIELPPAPSRNEAYEAVGNYVVNHCDVLLAIWDGQGAQGQGGTAEVVAIARDKGMPIAWVHAGNRKPGTLEPTTLGPEQGKVSFENFYIPFRIRIGVSGDRVLSDPKKLQEKIREVLGTEFLSSEIFKLYKESSQKLIRSAKYTPIAYTIVTCLAEGADRLLTREVLRVPNSAIRVLLPLPADEYEKTFPSLESRLEFRALLEKAKRPVPLEKQQAKGTDALLEAAGRHIVDHCDVLIVLRNHNRANAASYPAEVAKYARNKNRPIIVVSSVRYHLFHRSGLDAESMERFETFNGLRFSKKKENKEVQEAYKELFNESPKQTSAAGVTNDLSDMVYGKLLPWYVRASRLAARNKIGYQWTGLLAYSCSVLAVACVAVGTLVPRLSFRAFLAEFVILSAILSIVFFADRWRVHKKWIEARFLTERFRSAAYMAVCGVEPSAIYLPPYMGIAHGPDDWMIMVYNEVCSGLPVLNGCQGQACRLLGAFVRERWIEGQVRFHRVKSDKMEWMSRVLEVLGMILFGIAMIAAICHIVLSLLGEFHGMKWEKILTLVALILPALAASLEGIRHHREYSRLGKLSRNIRQPLEELEQRFRGVKDPDTLESLLKETEELALRENQGWLMLMRFIKLEPLP